MAYVTTLLASKTSVTGGNATKSAYTPLIASTAAQYDGIVIRCRPTSGAVRMLIDIATGAALSETVVIANIPIRTNTTTALFSIFVPLRIAAGTRLAISAQGNAASQTLMVTVHGVVGSFTSYATCTTYGADLANTTGTVVDGGGSANTEGNWAELTAACAADHDMLLVSLLSPVTNSAATGDLMADIGTGAAASETAVLNDLLLNVTTGPVNWNPCQPMWPASTISSGTRIAARCQATTTDANGRTSGVIVHAMSSPFTTTSTTTIRRGEAMFTRKYGTLLAGAKLIRMQLFKTDGTRATDATWTPGAGDVKVSKDAGATANIGTLPAYTNGAWEFILTATELTAQQVNVTIDDATIVSADFTVETFGNALAMYPDDLSSTDRPEVNVMEVLGDELAVGGDAPASPIGFA